MLKSNNTKGPVIIISTQISFAVNFGIAYIAGYLVDRGESVRILYKPSDSKGFQAFASEIMSLKPLVVAFGSLYPDLYHTQEIVKLLDEMGRDFPVALGGQMVSPTPEFTLEVTGSDYGVVGEGEIIFSDLVAKLREGLDASSVKGVMTRDGKEFKFEGPGDYIKDLSKLPKIPYDLFPTEKMINIGRFYVGLAQPHWRYKDRVVSIHGGRGCPFNCNFCYHHSKPRYRPIPDMMAEAEELVEKFGANILYFGDDLVLATPKRARELTEALLKFKKPIEYSVSCRFDILSRIDDGLLREMKRTGCRIMGLGIESGSQRMLDVMNKKITVEQIRAGLTRLKKAGILPTVSIMVGQLSETAEENDMSIALMLDTVRENSNIQYAFTITTPFPGSELYDIAFQKGLIKSHMDFYEKFNPARQMSAVSVNLSAMSDAELIERRDRAERLFNEEKDRLRGTVSAYLEKGRRFAARVDGAYERKISPAVKCKSVDKIVHSIHDCAQNAFDCLRLRLMGLK